MLGRVSKADLEKNIGTLCFYNVDSIRTYEQKKEVR